MTCKCIQMFKFDMVWSSFLSFENQPLEPKHLFCASASRVFKNETCLCCLTAGTWKPSENKSSWSGNLVESHIPLRICLVLVQLQPVYHSTHLCAVLITSYQEQAMLDHVGSCWIMLDHVGSCWIMLDHDGSCWIMLDHVGSCWIYIWVCLKMGYIPNEIAI